MHWAEQHYTNTLRLARMRAGIRTQQELAEISGVARYVINRIENEKILLSIALALRFCEVLHCSLDDLYVKRAPIPVGVRPRALRVQSISTAQRHAAVSTLL